MTTLVLCTFGLSLLMISIREFVYKRGSFNTRMTMYNLIIGMIGDFAFFAAAPMILLYQWLFLSTQKVHLAWSMNIWWHWIVAFVLVDLAYFVFHVLAHNCNIFWGSHSVHHQSTDFNISAGLKEGVLEGYLMHAVSLPLALIGVPTSMLFACRVLNGFYTVCFHTETIGKLGLYEYIFNTPSQHRIHHYKNFAELGKAKNFGGVFSIWDRLFGQFHEEQERVTLFGINEPAPIYSPIRCQTYFYRHLWKVFWQVPAKDKLRLLFTNYMPVPVPAAPPGEAGPLHLRKWHWAFVFVTVLTIFWRVDSVLVGNSAAPAISWDFALTGVFVLLSCVLLAFLNRLFAGKPVTAWRWGVAISSLSVLMIMSAIQGINGTLSWPFGLIAFSKSLIIFSLF